MTHHLQSRNFNLDARPATLCGLKTYRNYLILDHSGAGLHWDSENLCPSCAITHMVNPEGTCTSTYWHYMTNFDVHDG